jgi:hypothetical protein
MEAKMAVFKTPSNLLDTLSIPVGDLIYSVGNSVAQAQHQLDAQAIENFKSIYREGEHALSELKKIGYQPTWYHFPETTAELRIALTVAGSYEGTTSTQPTTGSSHATPAGTKMQMKAMKLYAAPADGAFTGKYNYDLRASTKITFKIVPVPPPVAVAEMAIAPDLVSEQTTVAHAKLRLGERGIPATFTHEEAGKDVSDDYIVTKQDPGPGEIVLAGSEMTITVKDGA